MRKRLKTTEIEHSFLCCRYRQIDIVIYLFPSCDIQCRLLNGGSVHSPLTALDRTSDSQWLKVTKYMYSSTVQIGDIFTSFLLDYLPIFRTFTYTRLHLRGKYFPFTPLQLFEDFSYFVDFYYYKTCINHFIPIYLGYYLQACRSAISKIFVYMLSTWEMGHSAQWYFEYILMPILWYFYSSKC